MSPSLRILSRSILPFVAIYLWAPSAHAQGAPSRASTTDDIQQRAHEEFCRDHWFAVAQCRERGWTGPQLVLGVDLGVSAMNESGPVGFDSGVGAVTDPGPAWGLRVGVELFSWLSLEARYLGMWNSAQGSVSPLGSVGFFTTAGAGVVRLTAPLPYVHPYVFGGIGYYDNALVGSAPALPGSQLFSSYEPGTPLGIGVDVPLTWHLSLGLEATYHHLIGEVFSSNTVNGIDGGDISTVNVVLLIRP